MVVIVVVVCLFVCLFSQFGGSSNCFRPILNFPIFRKNGASLELLKNVFENSLPKWFFGEIKKKFDSPSLQTTALKMEKSK